MKIFLFLFLVSSASGIIINCEFYTEYNWEDLGDVYGCAVSLADFSDNSTHITGYEGTHFDKKSSVDVKHVAFGWFEKCPENLQKIPKGISKIFPNLIGLLFEGCPFSTLNDDELDEYPNLQYYSHNHSNMKRIPGNFFKSTPNMKVIDFNYNKIKNVGANLLDHLKNLQHVHFSGNSCIDKYVGSSSGVPALIEELRQKCPDNEPETTTQLTTTT
jgi:hypothetical protein